MKANPIKIISDGTPGGTLILLADGTNIASQATRVEIVIEPGKLCRAVITFPGVKLDVVADAAPQEV